MYAVVGTVVTALFIPSIVGWIRSKRAARKLNEYHEKIKALSKKDDKLDEDKITQLNEFRVEILDAYSKGKISEKHYESLRNETLIHNEKIFRNRISTLNRDNSSNKKPREEQLNNIRNDLEYAYSEGKISEIHYESLKDEISIQYDKIFRKKIDDASKSETKKQQLNKIRNDLEYAYSEGKISEKHYDLLNKAISNLDGKQD
ncbi:MAG TPA: hypothetical protein VKA95_01085 [Nitrososphaeraceae archaeon]|nr:hypothetical protein [Nitrososphaeraceae archaeon]